MHVLLGPAANIPLLVAPMGASAVLLFAVPASPLAQPWSIIGGNIVSATVGVACASWIADPLGAAALAVALAICAMFALRCVHPPSGAVALTAVLGGPAVHALGYRFVAEPIAIQSVMLLCAAIIYHAATGHRYPHVAQSSGKGAAASAAASNEGFTRADLEAVLNRRGELLDIDTDDLESLLRDVQLQAYARTFNELTCADIMSRSLVAVSAITRASAAWSLLKQRHIKALPVTDEKQHVIGIVTRADLVDKRAYQQRRRSVVPHATLVPAQHHAGAARRCADERRRSHGRRGDADRRTGAGVRELRAPPYPGSGLESAACRNDHAGRPHRRDSIARLTPGSDTRHSHCHRTIEALAHEYVHKYHIVI